MSGIVNDDILQSYERGAYEYERMEESIGAISGESNAYQLNDTIALERDARTEG